MAGNNGSLDYIDANLNDEEVKTWDGDSQFTPVDPGDYEVQISEAPISTSKSGNPMHTVTFEVMGNADGSDSDMRGQTCRGWYVTQGKGRGRLKNLLLAAGVKIDSRGGYKASELIGKRLLVTVVSQEYNALDESTGQEVTKSGSKVLRERPAERTQKSSARVQGARVR